MYTFFMLIRSAERKDADTLAALAENTLREAWTAGGFADAIEDKSFFVYICENESEPIGYCVFSVAGDEAELLLIGVLNEHRRLGAGEALFKRLLSDAGDTGAGRLYLEVRSSNEAAIGFYIKQGMEELGIRKGFYREPVEDALVFGMDIKDA